MTPFTPSETALLRVGLIPERLRPEPQKPSREAIVAFLQHGVIRQQERRPTGFQLLLHYFDTDHPRD